MITRQNNTINFTEDGEQRLRTYYAENYEFGNIDLSLLNQNHEGILELNLIEEEQHRRYGPEDAEKTMELYRDREFVMECAGMLECCIGIVLYAVSIVNYANPKMNGANSNGLYRVSRNPMYTAYFIYFFGCVLLTHSWILFAMLIIFQISAHWIILSEERWCIKKFGEQYLRYMNETRRYL